MCRSKSLSAGSQISLLELETYAASAFYSLGLGDPSCWLPGTSRLPGDCRTPYLLWTQYRIAKTQEGGLAQAHPARQRGSPRRDTTVLNLSIRLKMYGT